MTRSKNMVIDHNQELINRMAHGDTKAIIEGINSEIPILNLNAICCGAGIKCLDEAFVDLLSSRFLDSDMSFMGTEIKKYASAALDVIGVKEYRGDDSFVLELIASEFSAFLN